MIKTFLAIILLFTTNLCYCQNFIISGNIDEKQKEEITKRVEYCRKKLSLEWNNKELENWNFKCVLTVKVENRGGGGATTFSLLGPEIKSIKMDINGRYDELIDNVIPHEVMHTVLRSNYKDIIPRWIDEGIAMQAETPEEQQKYLTINKYMSFNRIMYSEEYPDDVYTFYGQSYLMVKWFMKISKNKEQFVKFLEDGLENDWKYAVKVNYNFNSLEDAQKQWEHDKRGR